MVVIFCDPVEPQIREKAMYNVIQCNHTMPANRQARDWGRILGRKRGFCTLLVVSAVLCVLSGCGGGTPGPSPAASEPTDDLSVIAQPSQAATALLTSTATVTTTVADTITITVTDTVPAPVNAVTDTKVLTPTLNEGPITYTVKAGDTLTAIASKYSTTVEAIKAVNGLTSNDIYAGDVFTIPQTIALPLVSSPTVIPTATATLSAPAQSTSEDGSNTDGQSSWLPLSWMTENSKKLAIYASLLATFLIVVIVLLALRRGHSARASPTPTHPPLPAAPISAGLAGPPAAGTAYLETRLDATGAMLYYPLAQKVISIGRDPSNSIVIDQRFAEADTVSHQHVQIVRAGDGFIAKDLGSANGLLINRRRSRENVLRDGVILGIGKTQFVFRLNQPGGTA